MTAQEYLEERQRLYRRYDYLVKILQTRRDLVTSTKLDVVADNDIPHYTCEIVATTVDGLMKDTPEELRERMKVDVVAYLTGTHPEIGWVQRAHNAFLGKLPDMASIENLDIAVGELETASFNGSAIPVPG